MLHYLRRRRGPQRRSLHGFTLIELLVVIAIISLLVSILLPSLNKAKALARSVVCLNILRSFGLADAMYAEESDGWLVPVRYGLGWTTWQRNGLFRIGLGLPEDNSSNAPSGMICPEAKLSLQDPDSQGWYPMQRSWGINATDQDLSLQDIAYQLSEIAYPDRKLLFADAMDWWIIEWFSDAYVGEDTYAGMEAAYRHDHQIHIGFFDGHVESMHRNDVVFNDDLWKPLY